MDTIQLGPWQFSAANFCISDNSQKIELEPLLCKLLQFFASNSGRIVSRQELIDAIWQQSFVDDNAINRAISELRKVLQHPTLQQSPIKTHHRKGYSLQLGELNQDTSLAANSTRPTKHNVTRQKNVTPYFVVVTGIILIAALSYWFFSANDSIKQPEISATTDAKPPAFNLTIKTNQKVTWFKGTESRPLLSPNKQLLAYTHTLPNGSLRVLVRKATLSVTQQALQEIAIESADSHYAVQSWQPQSERLLVQTVNKEGKSCQYLVYDFSDFPHYNVTSLSQCTGFTMGNAQISVDGQSLYRSTSVNGISGASALVVENLNTADKQTLLDAPTAGLGVTILALSPDGSKLAYIYMPESNKPEIFIYTPATREHQRLLATPFAVLLMGLEWSADQSTLYLPGYDTILKIDITSKALTLLKLPKGAAVGEMSMLSGNQAYTSALSVTKMAQNAMQLVKVTNPFDEHRRQFTPLSNAEGSAMSLAHSPTADNRYAFSANWSGSWQLWLHDNGKEKQLTELVDATQPLKDTNWSNDGRYIAFSKSGNLYLYDTQRQLLIPKLENNDMGQAIWLADNSGIVFTRITENSQNLWQLDLVSNELTQLTFSGGYQALFNDDGKLLYHRDGKLIRYVDGRRADIEVLGADNSENYLPMPLFKNNEQWRFGMLGHVQRRLLSGEVLQQTQLPYQIIGMNFNPFNPDELYLTVFVTPEMAIEFIEWQVDSE